MVQESATRASHASGDKHQVVLAELKRRIIQNKFASGSRLPTCRQLAKEFCASPMTAQRVLNRLVSDGFLMAHGRRGKHVHDLPPHLFRYGIVFSSDPSGGELGYWPPAWKALNDEALRVEHVDLRRQVVSYYNITGHTDTKDYRRLIRDVNESRLAGLMLVAPVRLPALFETPEFKEKDVPRVVMFGDSPNARALSIPVSFWQFLGRALDYLASQGHKRVALFDVPDSPLIDVNRVLAELAKRGMTTHPYWLLPVDHRTGHSARPVVQLLMSGRKEDRPDALIIANAFLVEHVTAGLVDTGLRVPRELEVVAGGNYPHLTRSLVPVKWLVADVREGVRLGIELIDRCRRGEQPEPVGPLPDLFEEELPTIDPLTLLVQQLDRGSAKRILAAN